MDSATLIAMDAVLRERSVRGAARLLNRPVSSIAASVARLEGEISVRLVERAGAGLVTTLEAVRLGPEIAAAAQLASQLGARRTIKLETLERFTQVAAQGSIRRAARVMGLGQPQLTRQLAQLELAFGTALLDRSRDGSSLTADGLALADRASTLLQAWRRLSLASEERFRKTAATARLGSVIPLGYESEIARLLASLAARWHREQPRVPLFMSSTTAEDLLRGLKNGQFDAALLDTEALPPDLDGRIVTRTALAIVGAAAADTKAALLSAPLAVPSSRSGLRQRINRILEETLSPAERLRVRLVEIDSIPVILNMVLHHGFVSVLPQASVARIRSELRQVALPPQYDMNFWLCWPRGNAAIGRAVLSTIDQSRAPEGLIAKPAS
jgi:LysR family transcriptional regulator, nitrogen assimilation regulatory protein